MKDDERNYLEQWLEKAEHDLLAARLILDSSTNNFGYILFPLSAGSGKISKNLFNLT